ncbi:argininosuccinate lyase [Herpetosiphon llansteffanensis]
MWGGRFSGSLAEHMRLFNDSFPIDRRLWAEDIRGSIAWANGLERAGILQADECQELIAGLRQVAQEFAEGLFLPLTSDEDIHTAVERRLGDFIGALAGKLHTGRSRNDQVATDTRLWTLGALKLADDLIRDVQAALLEQAKAVGDAILPGYTHLQRAQPVLLSHALLAHFWRLDRDRQRLHDATKRVSVLPLGSGALAGTAFAVDRAALAAELGFASISQNSLDATSDRDYIVEILAATALLGVHISQLAEDWIIWSSAEWGFVALDDAYSTGSSLMPQKKNPDSLELARGKSGRLIGNLVTVLTLLKGLPSAYDKDLQEDKAPLFDAIDTLSLTLPVVAGAIRTARFNTERMEAALDDAMLATDVADELVRRGVPFREAHHIAGRLVREAEQRAVGMRQLPAESFVAAHPSLTDVAGLFDFARSVAMRDVPGGTAPNAVRDQLIAAQHVLAEG